MNLGPHAIFIIASYIVAIGGLAILAYASWRAARDASQAVTRSRGQSIL